MQNAGSTGSAPNFRPNSTNIVAVAISMINGSFPIGVPQCRHLPRSTSQLPIGTRSGTVSRLPHAPQALGGCTTDPPRGTRSTTTVRNEPTNNPITMQAIKTSVVSISSAR